MDLILLITLGRPVSFKRKNGRLRIRIDYRAVNRGTVKYAYQMPRFEELLPKLHGFEVFQNLTCLMASTRLGFSPITFTNPLL